MRDNAKGGALTEVTFYILLSLYTPKHGYAVMQFIEEKTDGRLSLGAGTLYGALNSLQDKKIHTLSDYAEELLTNRALCREIQNNAYTEFKHKYTWEEKAKQLLACTLK